MYATDGDESLGGSDFDICVAQIIDHKLKAASFLDEKDNQPLKGIQSDDIIHDVCISSDHRMLAESVKKALSSKSSVGIQCNNPSPKAKNVHFQISIEEFHQECNYLFEKSLVSVNRLLNSLEMTPDMIDEIVLVGGTTRIPKIKGLLKEYFGARTNINDKIDPDVTVAYGAASIID